MENTHKFVTSIIYELLDGIANDKNFELIYKLMHVSRWWKTTILNNSKLWKSITYLKFMYMYVQRPLFNSMIMASSHGTRLFEHQSAQRWRLLCCFLNNCRRKEIIVKKSKIISFCQDGRIGLLPSGINTIMHFRSLIEKYRRLIPYGYGYESFVGEDDVIYLCVSRKRKRKRTKSIRSCRQQLLISDGSELYVLKEGAQLFNIHIGVGVYFNNGFFGLRATINNFDTSENKQYTFSTHKECLNVMRKWK